MKIKKLIPTVMAMAIVTFVYAATDINGHWKGSINDQIEVAYDFKVDGQKLSGSTQGPDGNTIQLTDGWFKDDSLAFTLPIMDQQFKMTGKVKSADQIVLYMKGGPMGDMSYVIKKTK
ncbi:hypothetical protein KXD93_02635 [Mucilaginibacter sp. BJC16-A38]|uniref:hypothetical protein n=1 Tax=Mucilaginibacter phenanthrenivorans TaxID=1234842 RepID=UPI002158619C|nr:hypothetical protein [Mucilaginibacter phenanthrenivorans]MCR8556518.1 hypothetical protein [Mucilaginibacter phenanthrenivorans]